MTAKGWTAGPADCLVDESSGQALTIMAALLKNSREEKQQVLENPEPFWSMTPLRDAHRSPRPRCPPEQGYTWAIWGPQGSL